MKRSTGLVLAEADVVAEEPVYYHRTHPVHLNLRKCGFNDKVNGSHGMGTLASHASWGTVTSLISGIAEHNIRILSPDIGGGFWDTVGKFTQAIYDRGIYCCGCAPVKWIEI